MLALRLTVMVMMMMVLMIMTTTGLDDVHVALHYHQR